MEKERLIAPVEGAKRGDTEAAGGLYEGFRQDIYYFILKNVSNDSQLAEDLTQDTFIEILDTIDKLQEPAAFPGWARQIAYHKCTAYFRKRHELLADENEDGQTMFDTIQEDRTEFIPDEALDHEELKKTILAMIRDLPEEQRSAIMLRYYNEVSVKEIAQMQGVSENTVKSRLNYGRKTIKQAVEAYEKKNGIKLHSVAIVPLLLWLFRQQAVSAGVSVTTKTAAVAITTGAASAGSTTAAATAVTTGTKAAGKFTAKKIIAGIAAAAVVTGGVTAGILLNKDEPELPKEEQVMTWYGHERYSDATGEFEHCAAWIDMRVDKMSDTFISGSLVVTEENDVIYQVSFEGEGVVEEEETDDREMEATGRVIYTIIFDQPIVVERIGGDTAHTQDTLIYDKETDTFTIQHFCNDLWSVTMVRTGNEDVKVMAKDEVWVGDGWDNFEERDFRFEVYKMTNIGIRGKLTVLLDGEVVHETEFSGRGYQIHQYYWYHLVLEIPKETAGDYQDEDFLLIRYDENMDVFKVKSILTSPIYRFTLERETSS